MDNENEKSKSKVPIWQKSNLTSTRGVCTLSDLIKCATVAVRTFGKEALL